MPTTYTHIATTELSSSQASVDFTSLGSYTDLIFYCQFATSQLAYIEAQIGSGTYTTSGYYTQVTDSGPSAYVYSNTNSFRVGYSTAFTGLEGFSVFELHQYRNTNTYRVMSGYVGHTGAGGAQSSSRLVSTTAIDRIKFFGSAGNLISGTKISVYGITEA